MMNIVRVSLWVGVLSLSVSLLLMPKVGQASVTNGTIESGNQLAKVCKDTACSVFGRINFKPTLNSSTPGAIAVAITDSGVTGHVWGDELGWIHMSPTGGGVTLNPSTGILSGRAFSSVGGWINFAPTGQTVRLVDNGSGSNFYGFAFVSGLNGGWLKFDCADTSACVKTDWRSTAHRTVVSSSGGGGGGGATASSPTPAPTPTNQTSPEPTPVTEVLTPPLLVTPPFVSPTVGQPGGRSGDSGSSGQGVLNTSPISGLGTAAELSPEALAFEQLTGLETLSPTRMAQDKLYLAFGTSKIIFPAKQGGFTVNRNGKIEHFSGTYYRVGVGNKLTFNVKPKKEPKSIKLVYEYKGELVETRRTFVPKWTWLDRIRDIFGLSRKKLNWNYIRTVRAAAEDVDVKSLEGFTRNSDGVYTKEFTIEERPGLYNIKTVLEYTDGEVEEVDSTSVVFDRGESFGLPERFLVGRSPYVQTNLTLYQKNEQTGEFVVWDAVPYEQKNPLVTAKDGAYSIVAPPGTYKIAAEADGYYPYTTSEFIVAGDERIINPRIAMVCKFWSSFGCMWPPKLVISTIAFCVVLGMVRKYRRRK